MKTLMAVLVVLSMAVPAMAEKRSTTVSYDFTSSPEEIADNVLPVTVKLYKNDVFACEHPYTEEHTFNCDVDYTPPDRVLIDGVWRYRANFVATFIDNYGRESAVSNIAAAVSKTPAPAPPLLHAPTLNVVIP